MEQYFSAKELAGMPGQPGTPRMVQIRANKDNLPYRKRQGRGGGREYPVQAFLIPLESSAVKDRDLAALELGQAIVAKRKAGQKERMAMLKLEMGEE